MRWVLLVALLLTLACAPSAGIRVSRIPTGNPQSGFFDAGVKTGYERYRTAETIPDAESLRRGEGLPVFLPTYYSDERQVNRYREGYLAGVERARAELHERSKPVCRPGNPVCWEKLRAMQKALDEVERRDHANKVIAEQEARRRRSHQPYLAAHQRYLALRRAERKSRSATPTPPRPREEPGAEDRAKAATIHRLLASERTYCGGFFGETSMRDRVKGIAASRTAPPFVREAYAERYGSLDRDTARAEVAVRRYVPHTCFLGDD